MDPDQRQSKLSRVKIKDHSLYNAIMYNLPEIGEDSDLEEEPDFEYYDTDEEDYFRDLLVPPPASGWDNVYNDFIRPNILLSSKIKDQTGRCILHYACETKAPEYIVKKLIENNQKAIQSKTDKEDAYPLHLACQYEQSESVILHLLKLFPKAAQHKVKFHERFEEYPLTIALQQDVSETVIVQLLKVFPEVARLEQSTYGFYPLHLALHGRCFRPSEAVVLKLLDLFPAAVQHDTLSDRFPLHMALRPHSLFYSEGVVLRLLEGFREAARHKTNEGWYPLHLACDRYTRDQSKQIIRYLVEEYPEACQQKTDAGKYPLHIACEFSAPRSVLKLLLMHFPDALEMVDRIHHRTPLDWAHHPIWGLPSAENIEFLIDLIAKKQTVTVHKRKRIL